MWETPHVTTTVGSLWVKGCSAASTSLRFLASESVWRRVTGSGQGCCGPPPLTDLSARKHNPGSVTCCLDCTDSYVCSPVFVGVVDMHPLCTRWVYHHAGCSALIGLLLVGKKCVWRWERNWCSRISPSLITLSYYLSELSLSGKLR